MARALAWRASAGARAALPPMQERQAREYLPERELGPHVGVQAQDVQRLGVRTRRLVRSSGEQSIRPFRIRPLRVDGLGGPMRLPAAPERHELAVRDNRPHAASPLTLSVTDGELPGITAQ